MALYQDYGQLIESISGLIEIESDFKGVKVLNESTLRESLIDELIYNAIFNENSELLMASRWVIRASAQAIGIFPSSIQSVYEAMAANKLRGLTAPAINIRGMTYDFARSIQRAAKAKSAFPVIFEIAKSEMAYTLQNPSEYATCIIAAAIKENFKGPVYIQGDHFQINAKKYAQDPDGQVKEIEQLTTDAIAAGFYNIDIDTSTLVDLSHDSLTEQQRLNFELGAHFTELIRKLEPEGVTVSVGGEIGEVGEKNSTVEELEAYMDGFQASLQSKGAFKGPSKISVQTGTSHGGVPLADGSVAEVNLDFDTLEKLSQVAKEKYHMSGAVQHGASTLPDELFHKFPEVETSEIHLATGFQNIVYEHPALPSNLKERIYAHLREAHADEQKSGQTDEQFIYKTRKKGFGPFKKEMWNLSDEIKSAIFSTLQDKFEFLFDKLAVSGKEEEVKQFATLDRVNVKAPESLQNAYASWQERKVG